MYTKKTKIVATIGPATEEEKNLERLIKHGVNVIRLNFSHGSYEEHGNRITRARSISQRLGLPIGVLQDLSGPKIRIGEFETERVILVPGETFTLTTKEVVGNKNLAYVNYAKLPQEVKVGNTIFLDDGKKRLEVTETKEDEVICKIIIGGETKGKRGVNVPGAYLSISSLTDKDKRDLEFGVEQKVDFMAISFVRRPSDVAELREILKSKDASDIKIISKIETQEAVDNIDEIIDISDGIMVARGDLAIEVPTEQVPFIQKTIITKCHKIGIPVITATQMLESMIKSPVPTRAEVSDVANAIYDGTDAIMLSEETTLGDYPYEAVDVMHRVATHTEKVIAGEEYPRREYFARGDITDAISYAAENMAYNVKAKAIVVLSNTGFTARMVSRHKPNVPMIVFTPNEKVYNQLALSYGCYPLMVKVFDDLGAVKAEAKKLLLDKKLAKEGDTILLVAGLPLNEPGPTNMLLAEKI